MTRDQLVALALAVHIALTGWTLVRVVELGEQIARLEGSLNAGSAGPHARNP